ncbi:hypothetical protein [Cellulomonas edaphi]|uniref:Histidinol dehydrogenase n=1 Tax=Cellulomonas edaphi TaxID=3053468 RepID=A0ABT7S5B4_9CELL|nr:hypothetical protein [Cellulomons edaphi]MDM7830801.1 hypothetical protein [Cellulomons edaphi]
MQHLSPAIVAKSVAALALGLGVGAFGTVMHRSVPPWGAVLALVLVLSTGIMARAWGGLLALVGLALGVLVSVQVLSQTGPGGDVLVPSGDGVRAPWLGYLWAYGSIVLLVVAAVVPRRWFAEAPREGVDHDAGAA